MFLEKNALVVKIKACLKMSRWFVEKNTTMLSEVDTRRLQVIPQEKSYRAICLNYP